VGGGGAVAVGVFVSVAVGVLVAVAVGVSVGVSVGVAVEVLGGVFVAVAVGVLVCVRIGVLVAVLVAAAVRVAVAVGVLVCVRIGVLVAVLVGAAVRVAVAVGVRAGGGVASHGKVELPVTLRKSCRRMEQTRFGCTSHSSTSQYPVHSKRAAPERPEQVTACARTGAGIALRRAAVHRTVMQRATDLMRLRECTFMSGSFASRTCARFWGLFESRWKSARWKVGAVLCPACKLGNAGWTLSSVVSNCQLGKPAYGHQASGVFE
jgi:hypothetical protein